MQTPGEVRSRRPGRARSPRRARQPLRRNAFLRIAAGLPLTMVLGLGVTGIVEHAAGAGAAGTPVAVLAGVAAAYAGYVLVLARWMEGRHSPAELRLRASRREWLAGLALGGGLLLLVVSTIAVLGGAGIAPGGPVAAVVAAVFSGAVLPAFVEEIAFRGVLFRITEDSLGSWAATAVSSVLFGGAHMLNPNATPWSTAVLIVEAGLLLSAVYVLTHRLWICVGFHLAWNLLLVLGGLPLSGQTTPGLVAVRLHGPDPLTGGSFGPEASVVTAVLMTSTGAAIMWYAHRRGRLVPARRARRTRHRNRLHPQEEHPQEERPRGSDHRESSTRRHGSAT